MPVIFPTAGPLETTRCAISFVISNPSNACFELLSRSARGLLADSQHRRTIELPVLFHASNKFFVVLAKRDKPQLLKLCPDRWHLKRGCISLDDFRLNIR